MSSVLNLLKKPQTSVLNTHISPLSKSKGKGNVHKDRTSISRTVSHGGTSILTQTKKLPKGSRDLLVPGGFGQLPVDFFIDIDVESSLDKWQCHLESFHPQRWAVISNELQPLDPHQATVAGRILLQILQTKLVLGGKHYIRLLHCDLCGFSCSPDPFMEGNVTRTNKKLRLFHSWFLQTLVTAINQHIPVWGSPPHSWCQVHFADLLVDLRQSAWVPLHPTTAKWGQK